MKAKDGNPDEPKTGNNTISGVVAGTLVVLSTLALVAYLVVEMRSAPPVEIAEILAAASSLLAAAGAAFRATRSR